MLLNQMQHRGLMTGDTAYSAAISACEKGPEEQQVYSAVNPYSDATPRPPARRHRPQHSHKRV